MSRIALPFAVITTRLAMTLGLAGVRSMALLTEVIPENVAVAVEDGAVVEDAMGNFTRGAKGLPSI